MSRQRDLYFYEGEKPPPTSWEYQDEDGNLIPFAGTVVAKTSIDGAANADVPATNNADGTGTFDWPTGTSVFVLAGTIGGVMKIRIEVTDSPKVWSLPTMAIPIKKV